MAVGSGNAHVVAITGVSGYLGRRLLALLDADPAVERVVGIDIAKPQQREEARRAARGGRVLPRRAALEAWDQPGAARGAPFRHASLQTHRPWVAVGRARMRKNDLAKGAAATLGVVGAMALVRRSRKKGSD